MGGKARQGVPAGLPVHRGSKFEMVCSNIQMPHTIYCCRQPFYRRRACLFRRRTECQLMCSWMARHNTPLAIAVPSYYGSQKDPIDVSAVSTCFHLGYLYHVKTAISLKDISRCDNQCINPLSMDQSILFWYDVLLASPTLGVLVGVISRLSRSRSWSHASIHYFGSFLHLGFVFSLFLCLSHTQVLFLASTIVHLPRTGGPRKRGRTFVIREKASS